MYFDFDFDGIFRHRVSYGMSEAVECYIELSFENVPTEKIGDIYDKFKGTN